VGIPKSPSLPPFSKQKKSRKAGGFERVTGASEIFF
jgi:hypothetical protein